MASMLPSRKSPTERSPPTATSPPSSEPVRLPPRSTCLHIYIHKYIYIPSQLPLTHTVQPNAPGRSASASSTSPPTPPPHASTMETSRGNESSMPRASSRPGTVASSSSLAGQSWRSQGSHHPKKKVAALWGPESGRGLAGGRRPRHGQRHG